jgi:hypothetical protein
VSEATHGDEYDPKMFVRLELVWGDGFLSPNGCWAMTVVPHESELCTGCVRARKPGT